MTLAAQERMLLLHKELIGNKSVTKKIPTTAVVTKYHHGILVWLRMKIEAVAPLTALFSLLFLLLTIQLFRQLRSSSIPPPATVFRPAS